MILEHEIVLKTMKTLYKRYPESTDEHCGSEYPRITIVLIGKEKLNKFVHIFSEGVKTSDGDKLCSLIDGRTTCIVFDLKQNRVIALRGCGNIKGYKNNYDNLYGKVFMDLEDFLKEFFSAIGNPILHI